MNQFWFSWVVHKCLENSKSREWITWLLMVTPRKSGSGSQTSIKFDFVNKFFSQEIHHKVLSLGIQLIFSILWLWHLKISGKSVKKMVKKCKNNTKNRITWVWNKLGPKLQQLALNKGGFEKVALTEAVITWSLTMRPFIPEKKANSAKVNYSFHWKLKEDRAVILNDLEPDGYFWFRPSSGSKLGSKMDQKLELWVRHVTVKVWVLQNASRDICTTMRTAYDQKVSSIRYCLLELLPTKTPKWGQLGLEPKKRWGFFWLKLKTTNTQKLKLDIQKV